MLSPNDGSRIVLLPEDKELIRLAGWSEQEYREFVRYCKSASRIRPGEPVANGLDVILLQIGISLVLAAAAYFLTPKPKTQNRGTPAQLRSTATQGQDVVGGSRFAPKAGFDSLQNVVEMGSIVPLIYARRETLNGVTYGGVRVNTNLLWSQVLSLGGDQLFRGIFLVGEGDTRAASMELDPEQFALGNNLLGGYALEQNDTSRISLYYSNDGGRIVTGDYIAGRNPNSDPGNSNPGGGDVFQIPDVTGTNASQFCYAYKPSTQTAVGLFSWIGNAVCFRVNPSLRPAVRPELKARGNGNMRLLCGGDASELAQRDKQNARFSGMSGITALTGGTAGNDTTTMPEGSTITYRLSSQSSYTDTFDVDLSGAGIIGTATESLSANDVNTSVAARQVSFDEAIVLGELYKVGSALAICTARTGIPFNSEADAGANVNVEATFTVVREGIVSNVVNHSVQNSENNNFNCSNTAQIFRISRGAFVTEYPCRITEVGLRSNVGISINGLTNTIEGGYTYTNIDGQACPNAAAGVDNIPEETTLVTKNMVAGTVSTPEKRYSFFRISYRPAGTDDAFLDFDNIYGVASETQQPLYNYFRIEMPAEQRWEFVLEPVASWELRSGLYPNDWIVLDPKVEAQQISEEGNGVRVRYNGVVAGQGGGESIGGTDAYSIQFLSPIEASLEYDTQSMADPYARLAEAFNYNQLTTSVGGNPEHELVYINLVQPNVTEPLYEGLALIGMNIRASREFANLSQFSVYMNRGLGGFHDFPSVLRDLLTNDRFGVGEIVSPEQIDNAAFTAATTFTNSRNYYFDGALTEPLNIRTWGVERARDFLLDFVIRNGRFSLQPLLDFVNPEEITGIFTSGNILEDSFELTYFEQHQRQEPRISVRWRQEQVTGTANNRGLFPVVREVTVREAGVGSDAPLEEIDMSDFCTSQAHAIDRAKYECRFRRLSTHAVKFTTTTDQAALGLGKCFRLGMETLTFDQPQNGYIAQNGVITSWPEIADGTYTVQAWNGTGTAVTEQQLTVVGGTASELHGFVFCVADNVSRTQTYKVQSLSFNEEGNIDVEAIHWPTDAAGNSELVSGWDTAANWIIEGEI